MKTIFRFLSVGLLLTAFIAVSSIAVFAQSGCDDAAGKADLDGKFRNNYASKDIAARQTAVDAGKQYIEKYGECPDSKEFVDYLKANIPPMEERIKKEKAIQGVQARYGRFNAAYKAQNWDEVYAAGKEILASEPDNLDVILVLGSIGYDQSFKKNYKYNDDTLKYAKLAIQKINEGKTSKDYGVFDIQYKNKDNALGWMNLTIGYITFYAQNNKKEALPYLFAASQANSETKTNPVAFEPVGAYYFDDVRKLADEVKAMIAAQSDTDTPEVKAKKDADIKAKIALLNGTTERAMDAYARAYNIAKAKANTKTYADTLYKQLQTLYSVRFQKTEGLDSYIAAAVSKPMPDPTTAVTPIADAEATPVSATTTAPTPAVEKASTAAPGATKPAATVKAASASATTAKKPVTVKKKGTR